MVFHVVAWLVGWLVCFFGWLVFCLVGWLNGLLCDQYSFLQRFQVPKAECFESCYLCFPQSRHLNADMAP
jgi:hypothetical protein